MRLRILVAIMATAMAIAVSAKQKSTQPQPIFNRAPLVQVPYAQLPLGDITPQGWLHTQMQTMLDGMTGNLDNVYGFVVGDNNAWLGGEGDAWERGPYWIDGALPMAYIMGDKALLAKANKWVEAILYGGPNRYDAKEARMLTALMENAYIADKEKREVAFNL